jgi:hypothetical protein
MRFEYFVNEMRKPSIGIEGLYEKITKNCKQVLREINRGVLFRGVLSGGNFLEKIPRKNRLPLSTDIKTHEILDAAFQKKFGWKVRSEGVFCSRTYEGALGYGNIYVIFPVDGYKYVFNKDINDLYYYINYYEPSLDQVVKGYVDRGLGAYRGNGEISINCDKYYCVRARLMEEVDVMSDVSRLNYSDCLDFLKNYKSRD